MNDRLRFRAWDKSFCRMIYNIFFFWKENTITVYELHKDGSKSYLPNSHIVLEQCTGLKDKNGQLIYEGDIVKATFKYMGSNTENWCFAVAFSDGAFGYFDELGRFGLLANFGTGAMFQVVGNIHKNPELLEDK